MTAPSIQTDSKTLDATGISGPRSFVPLRESPDQADQYDGKRITLIKHGWGSLDDLVRQQNRQIEENVRMLAGQHHAVYHPVLGRYIDITEWMSDDERKWRQRPVMNRLMPWFVITHARATENQPIVTFVPGPDRADAELAEVLDVANKSIWFEANMEDVHDRLMGWVIAAGRGHLLSRINPNKGKNRKWVGTDLVPLFDEYGQPVIDESGEQVSQMFDDVPFDKQGNPLARGIQRYDGAIDMEPTGEAHSTPIGSIEVDVLSPMQVRASWGPQPWHHKRRHYIRSYHSPEEVWDLYGVDVEPTTKGGARDVGELERLLYGTGFYNSTGAIMDAQSSSANTDGYVEITQMWESPCGYGGMERGENQPGGRWLVATPNRVLRDGPRPAAFPYTSPLNTFEFIRMPGRPGGTTPLEALNPIQRAYNGLYGQIREHVNLVSNPKGVIDQASGMKGGKFTNKPGENYVLNRRPGVPAIEYVAPPPLGGDVYQLLGLLREEMQDIGFAQNNQDQGAPGESGEKLKEARFNTDRFLGPTMRRTAGEYGRLYENWQVMLPLVWDMETTIAYAGDDNIARTITVFPEMFKAGNVNVRPDVESMLPEGRGERQQQTYKMYLDGLFGEPGSPPALRKFWEMSRFPHLGRAAKPGGIHSTTAEQENGKLLLGDDPMSIPVWEWYDDEAHLAVHEHFMASPEFLKVSPDIQDAFVIHWKAHLHNVQMKQAAEIEMQAAANAALNPEAGGAPGGGPKRGAKQPSDTSSARPPLPSMPKGAEATTPGAPTPLPR